MQVVSNDFLISLLLEQGIHPEIQIYRYVLLEKVLSCLVQVCLFFIDKKEDIFTVDSNIYSVQKNRRFKEIFCNLC